MPKQNSNLKLSRLGRSNQKGYKENDFYKDNLFHFMFNTKIIIKI